MNLFPDIVGVWKLQGFHVESSRGKHVDWGQNAHGLLIYSDTGHVSVSINKDVVEGDILDSILFYSGTYQADGNVIRHNVTEASDPNRIGKELIRFAELKNNVLTLTTSTEASGSITVVWKKAVKIG